ncbi:LOW QUALITY PROTEIN: WDR3 isoform 1 [Pan troglodytes]|uniref:WD repeat domain 3 n=2 Tax=Pan troglodytes TaxID=9598 RepID=H2R3N2_PANTR|nr:LOW QUALITY PROTEIN: WDR3 isoform 1 [Pan troglodytes]
MGLTKQYLRYVASAVFGVIGSQKGLASQSSSFVFFATKF